MFVLMTSLHGPAGQLLWDLGSQVTLVDRLSPPEEVRNLDQAEWFRTELHTHRRKSGETLQSVYNVFVI